MVDAVPGRQDCDDAADLGTPLLRSSGSDCSDEDLRGVDRRSLHFVGCALIILIQIGNCMQKAPMINLYESIISRDFDSRQHLQLHVGNLPDNLSKDEAVQSELVLLRSWQTVLETLPSIFLAIPYGFVAEKYGPKLVLFLSVLGVVLGLGWSQLVCLLPNVLPIRAVWFSAAFYLIGGGVSVVVSMMYTITSLFTSEDERASTFFLFNAAILATDIIAIPMTSFLMDRGVWLPIIVGDCALILGLLAILPIKEPQSSKRDHYRLLEPTQSQYNQQPPNYTNEDNSSVKQRVATGLASARKKLNFLWDNKLGLLLLLTIFLSAVANGMPELLIIFVKKRLGWSLSRGNLLLALTALITLILFSALLPFGTKLLSHQCKLSLRATDLLLSRFSIFCLALGAFIIGWIPTTPAVISGVVITALGAGFPILLNNLISRTVISQHLSTLYSIVGVVDTFGSLISAPAFSALYQKGLELGGLWPGLPFIFAGGLYTVAAAVMVIAGLVNGGV
ncbi:MAG: hypothetical protein M1818_000514 [Claussenomyces sp. TS43310]|nr:MAG: hypothetical protein M1818_000514 [Claussenomyces sp. TS43310]